MAYTRSWDETRPVGSTTAANTIDSEIQYVRSDVRERLGDIFGISAAASFDDDPIAPATVKLNRVANSTILGGTVSFAIRNSADSANNVLISDAGVLTSRAGITILAGGIVVAGNSSLTGTLAITDDVALTATKKLYLDGGSNTYISEVSADKLQLVAGANQTVWVSATQVGIAGDVLLSATKKIYLDGGSDTYIVESGADQIDAYIGGAIGWRLNSSSFLPQGDLIVAATKKLYLDGGSDSYFIETSANRIDLYVGGSRRLLTNTSQHVVSTLDLVIDATKGLYLDGGGDSYIAENSANSVRLTVGGATNWTATATTLTFGTIAISGATSITAIGLIQTTLTTEQLRLRYDASNYLSVTVGSVGQVTFNSVGAGTTYNFTFSDAAIFNQSIKITTGDNSLPLWVTTGDGSGTVAKFDRSSGGSEKTVYIGAAGAANAFIASDGPLQLKTGVTLDQPYTTGTLSLNLTTTTAVFGGLAVSGATTWVGTGRISNTVTTEQTRFAYDASNYLSTTIDSSGNAIYNLVGTGSPYGHIFRYNGNNLVNFGSNGLISFNTIPLSGITDLTMSGDFKISATKKVYLDGGSDTYLIETSANQLDIFVGAVNTIRTTATVITHNVATSVTSLALSSTLVMSGTFTATIGFLIGGTQTAATGIGTAQRISTTLRSSANSDSLRSLTINSTADNLLGHTGLDYKAIYLFDTAGTGTIDTVYALKIDTQTRGATNYSLYIDGDVRFNAFTRLGSMATTNATAPTLCISNTTAPSGNPVGGSFEYAEAGALKARGTGGTVTTMAPA